MISFVLPKRCFSAESFWEDVDKIRSPLVHLRIPIQAYVALVMVHPQTSRINFALCPDPTERISDPRQADLSPCWAECSIIGQR